MKLRKLFHQVQWHRSHHAMFVEPGELLKAPVSLIQGVIGWSCEKEGQMGPHSGRTLGLSVVTVTTFQQC